jgi:hypothetical protein
MDNKRALAKLNEDIELLKQQKSVLLGEYKDDVESSGGFIDRYRQRAARTNRNVSRINQIAELERKMYELMNNFTKNVLQIAVSAEIAGLQAYAAEYTTKSLTEARDKAHSELSELIIKAQLRFGNNVLLIQQNETAKSVDGLADSMIENERKMLNTHIERLKSDLDRMFERIHLT